MCSLRQTPREAIEGTYIDKKCPFTGLVSIRGRILTGKVVSTKMTRTVIIRREYLHFVPKYSRCASTSFPAQLPEVGVGAEARVRRLTSLVLPLYQTRRGTRTSPFTARRHSASRLVTS